MDPRSADSCDRALVEDAEPGSIIRRQTRLSAFLIHDSLTVQHSLGLLGDVYLPVGATFEFKRSS